MKIDSSGILCSAKIDSNKACYTFSSFVSLSNGSILATARGGNNKDSELEGIEFFRSDDEGDNWSEPWQPFKNVEIDNLKGSLKLCYLTEISDSHIIASLLWIDRSSFPRTEGRKQRTKIKLRFPLHLTLSSISGGPRLRSCSTH